MKVLQIFLSGLVVTVFVLLITAFLSGCGDSGNDDPDTGNFSNEKKTGSDLTDWQMKNGFGPVKEKIELGEIDTELAATGKKIFDSKCASCHKLDERYIGPAQRDVLERISPEFFMNMVLNPDENIDKHPRTKKMLVEYNMTRMTNQNINRQDANALLEYFRLVGKEKPNK